MIWRYYYKYIWSCGSGTRKIHDDDKNSKIFDDIYSPTFTDRKTMTNDEIIDLYCEQIAFNPPKFAKMISKQYIKHGRNMEKLKNSWAKHVIKLFMIDMDFWDSEENLKEEKLNLVLNSKKFLDVIENKIKEGLKSEDEKNKEIMKLCQENVPSWEKYSVENGDFKIHKFSEGLQQASGDKYLRRVECIAAVASNSSNDEKNGPILKSVVVESNQKRGPNKQHELEQHVLKLIEDHGIHPKIYYHGKHYRIVEFIKGKPAFRLSIQLAGLGLLKFMFQHMFIHLFFF